MILVFIAPAYIGPGVGLSALGSLFSLVAAVGLAIVGFIWYPFKRLFGKKKQKTASEEQSNQQPSDHAE